MVFMSTASKEEAEIIVQKLLDKHLIACANILGPVESRFWWRNKIDRASEFLVLMKTKQELFNKLSEAVQRMHSYEIPEIVALSIARGSKPYLEWLNASLAKSAGT